MNLLESFNIENASKIEKLKKLIKLYNMFKLPKNSAYLNTLESLGIYLLT